MLLLAKKELSIPYTVGKIRLKVYGSKRELCDPKCELEFKVDLWIVKHNKKKRYNNKPLKTDFIQKCDFDLKQRKIWKNNEEIPISNLDFVLDTIKDNLLSIIKLADK